MKRFCIIFSALFALLLSSTLVSATEENPKDSTVGALHIKSKAQYATVTVNGDAAEPEFLDDGRTIIIGRLDRTQTYKVVVTDAMGSQGTAQIVVKPRDFKLMRVAKRVKEWRAIKRVRLKVSKKKAPKKEEAPEEDEPAPQPLPEDDDED